MLRDERMATNTAASQPPATMQLQLFSCCVNVQNDLKTSGLGSLRTSDAVQKPGPESASQPPLTAQTCRSELGLDAAVAACFTDIRCSPAISDLVEVSFAGQSGHLSSHSSPEVPGGLSNRFAHCYSEPLHKESNMSELQPIYELMLLLLCISVIPAALITWIWGGKALVYVCAATGLAIVAFLSWFAVAGDFSTGMEGLAFIIWPLLYFALCFGAFLGFGFVRIFKSS